MRVDRLSFKNFRNLQRVVYEPSPGINIVWGDNGQGKTNLLEGIYLFSHFKSFRGAGNAELVQGDSEHARISATIERSCVTRILDLNISKNSRSFLLDGKKPRPLERLLEVVRAILFAPDELYPLRTLPSARRSLLDRGIFQLDPSYLGRAVEYDRILKQRNRLLRERANRELIRLWTEQLIHVGAKVRQTRQLFVEEIQPYLQKNYEFFSGERGEVRFCYPHSAGTLQEYEDLFTEELMRVEKTEERTGVTCAGPQRDDPLFFLNDATMRHFASQGEWRTVVLSFKTAMMHLLHDRIGVFPILLFDDMSAELDASRQERLFTHLAESKAQVFVTTTDPKPLLCFGREKIDAVKMAAGEIHSE